MAEAYNYVRVATTGVSTISISKMGRLHGLVLNQQSSVAASSSLVTIYDNTTNAAPIIGIVQIANSGVGDYIYDCLFANGLTISVPSTATPVDLTVLLA